MNVLVAGGAGFIGSNLVDALLAEGHDVACIDNYFIGTKDNIAHLKGNSHFHMYEEDLTNFSAIDEIFAKEKIDFVFHMAANSDIQASAKSPKVEYDNTYTTTFNVLECMRLHGVKQLFFCSTSAVYGDALGAEVDENYSPMRPISYYGGCKLGCEGLISAFTYMNNFHTLMFRFPNVIGQRLTHGVIYDFVRKLKNNPHELEILGDGTQSKPYLHVNDLVSCIMRFKDALPEGITLFNVGDETASSVTRIAEIVVEKMGLKQVKFCYTGGRGGWKGDVPVFHYNLDKIHATGWKASMTSDEAVAKTVEAVL
ncbi:NAD-dependent epimerase/dehydratase family protein [uncultured Oscillibacter sp.]|uniref:NAD-dependent epimerase/dehydratase family protein n=1 Tax=uncultured Oscillibacter sp. TaxID=876091 RepID=UPI0025F28E67|nr:NAD-dependent epimerase/dehydratase family protein [uncultured Oscillibacter sp.]